jgi:hypothetical protein
MAWFSKYSGKLYLYLYDLLKTPRWVGHVAHMVKKEITWEADS